MGGHIASARDAPDGDPPLMVRGHRCSGPPREPRWRHHRTCRSAVDKGLQGERPRAIFQRRAHLRCNVTWLPACAGMTSDGVTGCPTPHPSPPRRRRPRSPGRMDHIRRRSPPRPRGPFQRPAHLRCDVTWVPASAGMTSREGPLPARTVLRGEPVEHGRRGRPSTRSGRRGMCDAGTTSVLADRFAFHCDGEVLAGPTHRRHPRVASKTRLRHDGGGPGHPAAWTTSAADHDRGRGGISAARTPGHFG